MKLLKQLWINFCQAVTILLALIYVIRLYIPTFPDTLFNLQPHKTAVIQQAPHASTQTTTSVVVDGNSFSQAASAAMPAVVNVYTSKKPRSFNSPLLNDPFFQFFFKDRLRQLERQQKPQTSLGSGVIVSAEGLVLTNHHVVADADTIEIALADGRKLSATRVGSDPETDIALLQVEADHLPVITFADLASLSIGDVVLAIGNPFGVGQTVTQGIVSALGREQRGINQNAFVDFIQTDASINPGNSGGALVNAQGQLVGINTAIYSKSGGSMGIGFAIPANLAKEILDQIVSNGGVTRGWIGVETKNMTPSIAAQYGLEIAAGTVITGIFRNSPAHKAGLKPGDIIIQINQSATGMDEFEMEQLIANMQPNDQAKLTILRQGEVIEIDVLVGTRPVQINR